MPEGGEVADGIKVDVAEDVLVSLTDVDRVVVVVVESVLVMSVEDDGDVDTVAERRVEGDGERVEEAEGDEGQRTGSVTTKLKLEMVCVHDAPPLAPVNPMIAVVSVRR